MPRGKRDRNESQIIQALRAAGCGVLQLEDPDNEGIPDLLITTSWSIMGESETLLMEVKMPGGKLSPGQVRWHSLWPGRVVLVHTPQEALAAVGLHAERIPRESRVIAQTGGSKKSTPAWPLR